MIVVIADDFSGAAEIGGIAHSLGMSSCVQTRFDASTNADVIVVDTDTRSLEPAEAAAKIRQQAREILNFSPQLVLKKIDSILRGPVMAEVEALIETMQLSRALMVAGNPGLCRVVQDGQLLIDGKPIDQTVFANDPEHPLQSSQVIRLLGAERRSDVHQLIRDNSVPESGITVPDTGNQSDLDYWASQVDSKTLAAGSSEFLETVLAALNDLVVDETTSPLRTGNSSAGIIASSTTNQSKMLMISGSQVAWDRCRAACQESSVPVVTLEKASAAPDEIPNQHGRLLLAIGGLPNASSAQLRKSLISTAVKTISQFSPELVLVEGGGTASDLMRQLGIEHLQVIENFSRGVVAVQSTTERHAGTVPTFIVKPGSYEWPDEWKQVFFKNALPAPSVQQGGSVA